MLKLGLTGEERLAFHRALRSSHTRQTYVTLLDLNGNAIRSLNHVVLDGQVTVDMDAEVTRSLNLTLLDPDHSLDFDTDTPNDGALFADRMIRVHYSVLVEELGRRVSVPIFTGPITRMERNRDTIEVEAQGKEVLGMGAIWKPRSFRKGARKDVYIRQLLRDEAGENRLSIPRSNIRTAKTVNLGRYSRPWPRAKAAANSMGMQLFYDGTGRAVLRHLPEKPVYTFRSGNGGDVVSEIGVTYELTDNIVNTVVVRGQQQAKGRIEAQAVAPAQHPLSPRRLGRRSKAGNFVPRHMVEVIENDGIRTKKAAKQRAKKRLNNVLREAVEVTFDTLPVPHLDPGDLVRVRTDDFTASFRLRQFTIPLGASGNPTMSIGYLKRVKIKKGRIRR